MMVSDEQDPDRRRQTQRGQECMLCPPECQAAKVFAPLREIYSCTSTRAGPELVSRKGAEAQR